MLTSAYEGSVRSVESQARSAISSRMAWETWVLSRSQTSTIGALTSWWTPSISTMKSRSPMLRRHRRPHLQQLERGRGDAVSVLGADAGKGVRGDKERLLLAQAVVGLQQLIDVAAAAARSASSVSHSGRRNTGAAAEQVAVAKDAESCAQCASPAPEAATSGPRVAPRRRGGSDPTVPTYVAAHGRPLPQARHGRRHRCGAPRPGA
jgi:hypothetical protein